MDREFFVIAVNIDMFCSGNWYFRVLRLPNKTLGQDLHFGGVIWLNLNSEHAFWSKPSRFLSCSTPSQFLCQIWTPDQASSLPKDRYRLEVSGVVSNSSKYWNSNSNKYVLYCLSCRKYRSLFVREFVFLGLKLPKETPGQDLHSGGGHSAQS